MIIITGASRGIGKYLFESLSRNHTKVMGTYFSTKEKGSGLHQLNVVDNKEVTRLMNTIVSERDSEIVLINCAGITYNSFAHKGDPELWRKVIETNLIGTYNCVNAVLPHMRSRKYGRIINFSSVVASRGTPGVSSYAASKSALWGFSRSVCVENASLGIAINNIDLGYSELGMIEQVPEKFLSNLIAQIPAKRLCQPKEILQTVEYLIECGYINGTSIKLNGGLV
jgi:acetoacetyl-CoA reductase/3-oxoacyl-[acyl-carrier protein] reductase